MAGFHDPTLIAVDHQRPCVKLGVGRGILAEISAQVAVLTGDHPGKPLRGRPDQQQDRYRDFLQIVRRELLRRPFHWHVGTAAPVASANPRQTGAQNIAMYNCLCTASIWRRNSTSHARIEEWFIWLRSPIGNTYGPRKPAEMAFTLARLARRHLVAIGIDHGGRDALLWAASLPKTMASLEVDDAGTSP